MKTSVLIRALLIGVTAAALSPQFVAAKQGAPARFNDVCSCIGCHAEYRWDGKTDEEQPPASVPHTAKPSDVGAWKGPGGVFSEHSGRKGREKQWYEVTGRVTLVKQEPDGDLHIQLVDEGSQDDSVNLVVEVPLGEPWCEVRKEVLSWTSQKIPFATNGKKLTLKTKPVIKVTGKAFYDAIHGGGDTTKNRRPVPKNASATSKNVTIWEIHPVMKLEVITQ